MADSEKGNSTADSKKKSAALDEDFGNDFLSFWGSSKKGKDKMDFDMEELPRNKKKSFNFDKLDDFELGGDFGKLPSFKMDMSDLDFSSPVMKAEKPTEKPTGKQGTKQDKFSFNFDFNELDRFDLGSSRVKGEKKLCKQGYGNSSDFSYKHATNQGSINNSDTSIDVFKDPENTKPLNQDIMATLRPENLMTDGMMKNSTPYISQDLEHHDVSHEVQESTVNQIAVAVENKNETHSNEGHKEQPQETCFTRTNAEKTTQDFILQSVSGDFSAEEDNPQFQVGPTSLDAVKADSPREREVSRRTVDSSHSRNSSPVNSYNTGSCPERSVIESLNDSGDFQKHCKWIQNEVTGGKEARSESTQGQMDIQNASVTNFSKNIPNKMKNIGEKQNLRSKLIPSPLQRDSRAVIPRSLNEKVIGALQLNSLSKSADNASQKTSATKKQLDSVLNNKLETLNTCPVDENIKPKKNHEQAETWKVGISKSYGEGSTRAIYDVSTSERDDEQSDTSSSQLKTSNLQRQTAATKAALLTRDFVSSTSSKDVPVEVTDTSLKDERTGDPKLMTSRKDYFTTELNSYAPNYATAKEAKSVRFSESSLKFPLIAVSKMANTTITEKSGSMNSLLKRKTFEESTADPEKFKPLKRAKESVTGRRPFEVFHKVERTVVPVTENLEAACADNYKEDLASDDVLKLGGLTDVDVPLLVDKVEKVEKTMELDDIAAVKQITVAEENRKEAHSSEEHREHSKGTCLAKMDFKLRTSSLQQQNAASNTARSIIPNFGSSMASMRSSKIVPLEINGSSKANKTFDCKLTIPSTTKLNSKMQNSAITKEAKSARFSESNSEFSLKTASRMAHSITEKSASFSAVLKRKTTEDSTGGPKNSNPLKHVMESAIGRKTFEVSPKTERALVSVTENLEAAHTEDCAEARKSNESPELGGLTGIEVIAPIEKDENVEKAEAYMKQLENMCDILSKNHEEARELLVRAVVNNNALLMLNHSLFEEKISSLQRFATSLQSKTYF